MIEMFWKRPARIQPAGVRTAPFRFIVHRRCRFACTHIVALTLAALTQTAGAFANDARAFQKAITDGDVQAAGELLKSHPELVNSRGVLGATPLHSAVVTGEKEMVELLLDNKADVSLTDEAGNTPLHYAAGMNNKPAMELLLARGARIDARTNLGRTPLHLAAEMDESGRLTLYSIFHPAKGSVPVMAASDEEVMEWLVANGAAIDAKDNSGATPLHLASLYGLNNKVIFLLTHGADPNAGTAGNSRPLHYAVLQHRLEVMASLLANKADVNAGACESPQLTIGGEPGRFGLTRYMFYMTNAPSVCGRTPLHWALVVGSSDTVEMLLSKGADVNAKDQQGHSALYLVDHSGLKSKVKNDLRELIRQHGGQ